MDTINSLLAPVGAAARHLSHALRRVQDDFQGQARKSGKGIKRDLGAARDELNAAVSRLGDATDHLRDTLATTKSEYADTLRDKYQAGTETLLDKYHAGAETLLDKYQAGANYARALKARASALTLPNMRGDRRYLTRNNVLVAGAAVGIGYVLYRAVRKLRTNAVDSARNEADDVATTAKPRSRKRAAAKPTKVAKTAATTTVNGAADTVRPH